MPALRLCRSQRARSCGRTGWLAWLVVVLWILSWVAPPAQAAEWAVAPAEVPMPGEVPAPPSDWAVVEGPFVQVHGPPERYRTLLRLARHASDRLPELSRELHVPIGDTIHVHVAESDDRFRAMQPGRAPSWADATAYPGLGVIYLRGHGARPGTDEPLETVLDHELVHVLLGRAFAPQRPPAWLQEGVAQVLARQYGPETVRTLGSGMASGGLIPLAELERGFPEDPMRARVAYAEAAHFVAWLRAEHGPDVLRVLVSDSAAGNSMDAAVRNATGWHLEQVEAAFAAELSSGVPLSVSVVSSSDLWWAVGAVLMVAAGLARRRRFRQRLAEMEAQERLVDALLLEVHRPTR